MATRCVNRLLVLALFALYAVPPGADTSALSRLRWLIRNKREECADGTYDFNGRTCCKCAAGQHLVENCKSSPEDRRCEPCTPETYNSEPNNKLTCEPCTSCAQPNANLEVEESCTPARNTKCKCKKDHFCESETCVICQPCRVCKEGIKSPCTAKENTVCINGTGLVPKVLGSISAIVVVVAAGVGGFMYWKKKKENRTHQSVPDSPEPEDNPSIPLDDLYPHLYEIAETIGWKNMAHLATKSNIKPAVIESCEKNHPNDTQAQTQELLKIWTEKTGRGASRTLIHMLNAIKVKGKAEDVERILRKTHNTHQPSV